MEGVLSPVSCSFCLLVSAQHKLIYDPGIIMAALGMETSSGDFEVIDICFAGIPDLVKTEAGPSGANGSVKGKEKARAGEGSEGQLPASLLMHSQLTSLEDKSDVKSSPDKTWIALASGLSVGTQEAPADLKVQLLVDWLIGEGGGPQVRFTLFGSLFNTVANEVCRIK